MEINFRPFKPEDNSELREMIFALYSEDPDGGKVKEENIAGTINELTVHPEKGSIVIFQSGEEIAGYGILVFYCSNEYGGDVLHLDELYVKPAWRNKNIASDFINSFSGKVKAIILEVIPTNSRAMRFYEKLGFKISKNIWFVKK